MSTILFSLVISFSHGLDIFVEPTSVGQPWGETEGLLQFRGNPTRTWYGTGPLSQNYEVAWKYPDKSMCSAFMGKSWCGTGWTGQPAIWKRPDGKMEVIVGTYDRSVHFIDFETGKALRKPFKTGELIKGSVTIDPNGYPLLYFGSCDKKYRILSLAGAEAEEIWSLRHNEGVDPMWFSSWDGNASVVNDHLIFGGENSWFYVWKLNRAKTSDGRVTVDPQIRVRMPGWSAELLKNVGNNVSIESSVAVFENRVYLTNSGGRVLGLDLSKVNEDLEAEVVFDFWTGDDTDASPVIDSEGMIYVTVEYERFLPRAREVGQIIKLDPYNPENPILWKVDVRKGDNTVGGLWATAALGKGMIYAATHDGRLLAVDTATGEVTSTFEIGFHAWSSPVVIDDRLLVATCSDGGFKIYDINQPAQPREISDFRLPSGSCIESTPAVWNGHIIVGSRDGYIYKFSGK